MWGKEKKYTGYWNFSFSQTVFKGLLFQGRENMGYFGKGCNGEKYMVNSLMLSPPNK